MMLISVAIVNKDSAEREAMKCTLSSSAFRVELYSAAEEFLATAWMAEAKCLIADSNLNDIAGVELTHHLAERGLNVPVVVVAASHSEAIRRKRTDQCLAVYLPRPFCAAQLIEAITNALSLTAESGGTGQRYCFGFEPHGVMDTEGHFFADEEAACREAQMVAKELARNRNPDPLERIVVTDGNGALVFEEYLIDRLQMDELLFDLDWAGRASVQGRLGGLTPSGP